LAAQFGIDLRQAGQYLPQIVALLQQNYPGELARAAAREPGIAGLLAQPPVGGLLGQLLTRFLGGR
jgi:hypothetical protein